MLIGTAGFTHQGEAHRLLNLHVLARLAQPSRGSAHGYWR